MQAEIHAAAADSAMMQIKPRTVYRMIVNIPATIYYRAAIYRDDVSMIYISGMIAPSRASGQVRMGRGAEKRE